MNQNLLHDKLSDSSVTTPHQAIVRVDDRGVVIDRQLPEDHPWLRALVDSMLFETAMRGHLQGQAAAPASVEQLWPGCFAAALPRDTDHHGRSFLVMLSRGLLDSEQFVRLCQSIGYDLELARKHIDSETLISDAAAAQQCQMFVQLATYESARDDQSQQIEALTQQLSDTYEELCLVQRLAASMTIKQELDVFLKSSLAEIRAALNLRWLAVKLADDQPRLGELKGRWFIDTDDTDTSLQPRIEKLTGQLRNSSLDFSQTCVIDPNTHYAKDMDLPESLIGCGALAMNMPGEPVPLGFLIGADKFAADQLTSIDSKLVTAMVQNLAVFCENSMLYDDLQDMFLGTLKALVNSIDAKDTYTCGHSERVAYLGQQLAKAVGLDEATVERVYLSGLVHDVGKIGVPEAVLTKPSRLSDDEFAMIKAHPSIGARIVSGIRQMQDLIPGVLSHHERYDGRGYPENLSGDDIPIFGRLLCLADSFDAMSSTRTYRTALPRQRVLDEVLDCAGTQFDPKMARAFVNMDFSEYDRMIEQHQQRQSPLDQCMRVNSP